ncbi:MAG: hypothetical protein QOH93_2292 [Chloroflexia bacterium]|jgi:DNA uptake protein ComE-like DNA-binding protein|nr:hypothetical protein [Chloroflexia bacterium]
MTRERTLMKTLTAVILVVVIALAGCGTSPEASTGPASTQTTVATATTGTSSTVSSTATTASKTTDSTPTAAAESTPVSEGTAQVAACAKLNLNDLTEDQLMTTIPGFSSRMVREFLEYRPYASIQQFRKEIGKYIDEATVATYEQYVYVPVDPNSSDAQTLMQLPGVDEATAGELVSGRPYASSEAFLAALGGKVDAQQLAAASCYLAANQ